MDKSRGKRRLAFDSSVRQRIECGAASKETVVQFELKRYRCSRPLLLLELGRGERGEEGGREGGKGRKRQKGKMKEDEQGW
jgi:hypothetical protein